jgi:hypothetical protein
VSSLILSVAIGLVFSFAVLAAVTSIITEGIARFLGLRGEYLLRGLRMMLDGDGDFALFGWLKTVRTLLSDAHLLPKKEQQSMKPVDLMSEVAPKDDPKWVTRVMEHPLISPSGSQGQVIPKAGDTKNPLRNKQRRKLPAYISARSFAQAIIDLAVPDAGGSTSFQSIEKAITDNVKSPVLQKSLLSLLKGAKGDMDEFRRAIERWYDDQMARVSGWYKRHVRWISLTIGLVLVVAFNVNAISIGRALYSDEALRGAVVTEAAQASDCTGDAATCLKSIDDQIAKAKTLGLPLGWKPIARCATTDDCSALDAYGLADPDHNGAADVFFFLTALLGYALMVVSIVPGARFWFDLLGRLGSLRSTGPKPTPST